MIELIGSLLLLTAAAFLFSAGLGLVRMPDSYTRIQTGTKAPTLGNILSVAGLAFYHPGWTRKLVLVIFFILMTNPVSSHALSRAAHRIRTPMTPASVTDALADAGHLWSGQRACRVTGRRLNLSTDADTAFRTDLSRPPN